LAQWDDGYADPWLILTDLNPTEANILWYGFCDRGLNALIEMLKAMLGSGTKPV
jgi:hypothetical protein